jgi:hypothetical protein
MKNRIKQDLKEACAAVGNSKVWLTEILNDECVLRGLPLWCSIDHRTITARDIAAKVRLDVIGHWSGRFCRAARSASRKLRHTKTSARPPRIKWRIEKARRDSMNRA